MMHDRRSIRAAHADGGSIRGIAREFGASRNAVRRAVDPEASLDYRRPSMSEEFEPAVRDVLADYPRISVSQVGEIVEWPGSRRNLSDLVAKLRPEVLDRAVEDLVSMKLGQLAVGTLQVGELHIGQMRIGELAVGRTDAPEAGSARAAGR